MLNLPSRPRTRSPTQTLAEAAAPLVDDTADQTEAAPAIDVTFEQLQKVWPGLFGGLRDVLGPRRWALFREAVPASVEGNTVVLEVAHPYHFSSLQEDDAVSRVVSTKASDLLGGQVNVRFALKDGGGALSASGSDQVDLSQLEERPDADHDPATLLQSELGARSHRRRLTVSEVMLCR